MHYYYICIERVATKPSYLNIDVAIVIFSNFCQNSEGRLTAVNVLTAISVGSDVGRNNFS